MATPTKKPQTKKRAPKATPRIQKQIEVASLEALSEIDSPKEESSKFGKGTLIAIAIAVVLALSAIAYAIWG